MGGVPTWLGTALAGCFVLVAAQRTVRRDLPGLLMAAGMVVMAAGMTGLAPGFGHGPWWAAGFLAVGLWPLVHRRVAGGGRLVHLLGALAMVYMCLSPSMASMTAMASVASVHPAGAAELVSVSTHHGAGHLVALPAAASAGALGAGVALLGWALACFFLLWTVSALTRRDRSGALAATRFGVLGALAEAAMGLGTLVMLVALT